MSKKSTLNNSMRVYHRYLGFFLAGIMAVYSISGIILIFRDTKFLKSEKTIVETLDKNIKLEDLGKALKVRDLKVDKEENGVVYFKQGNFDKNTGIATVTKEELPLVLEKMTKLHKASSKSPLFFMNIFFGLSLFFFVISSFWMFLPKTDIFKKSMYFTLAGIVLTLLMLFL
jgi:hypothetical protein